MVSRYGELWQVVLPLSKSPYLGTFAKGSNRIKKERELNDNEQLLHGISYDTMHTANTHIYVSNELEEEVSPKVGREKVRLNATCTSFKEAYKEAINAW